MADNWYCTSRLPQIDFTKKIWLTEKSLNFHTVESRPVLTIDLNMYISAPKEVCVSFFRFLQFSFLLPISHTFIFQKINLNKINTKNTFTQNCLYWLLGNCKNCNFSQFGANKTVQMFIFGNYQLWKLQFQTFLR